MVVLRPVQKDRTYLNIIGELTKYIRESNISVGTKLPTERNLCETMQVSRMVMREALSVLQWAGILEVKPGSGIFLAQIPESDIAKPLNILLLSKSDTIHDLLELRKILETECAALAAERATNEDIKRLEKTLAKFTKAVLQRRAGVDESFDFHSHVVLASHNNLMIRVFECIASVWRQAIRDMRSYSLLIEGEPQRTMEQHRRILKAIKAHSPDDAREAVREHISNIERKLEKIKTQ